MTYEQLCKDFLFDATKTTAQYKQGDYLIRLVKIPVSKHVEALYMSYNYMGRKEKYFFSREKTMDFAGYIVKHKEFKLSSYNFCKSAAEDIPDLDSDFSDRLSEKITRRAIEFVQNEPLLQLSEAVQKNAEKEGARLFFYELPQEPFPEFIKRDDITEDIVIDALSEEPGWDEKLAREFLKAEEPYGRGNRKEALLKNLAFREKAREVAAAYEEDKNSMLYQRREMKRAIGDAKTVTVDFVSKENTLETTKIEVKAFTYLNGGQAASISTYCISPEKERKRVETLACEKYSSEFPVERIMAIRYGKKVLWKKEQ